MEWGRTAKDNAAASYDSVVRVFNADGTIPEDGMRLVLEQAAREAKSTREILLAEVADLTILRQAQKELGIKPR
jgi:parvulin-like peptidyl-prolyl isomerase